MLNNVELQYKGLRILNRYCSCQDSEFRSALETSSVDIDKLLSKHFKKKKALIKKDDHLYIPADKTNNLYRVKPADYEQLLEKSVRKNYDKADRVAINDIIKADIHIAKNLDLAYRINTTAERESFITLKDYKENFKNRPTCRLINPCKPK